MVPEQRLKALMSWAEGRQSKSITLDRVERNVSSVIRPAGAQGTGSNVIWQLSSEDGKSGLRGSISGPITDLFGKEQPHCVLACHEKSQVANEILSVKSSKLKDAMKGKQTSIIFQPLEPF